MATKVFVGVPNPERLSHAQALERGKARLDAAYREDPALAVLLLNSVGNVVASLAGEDARRVNPFTLLTAIGSIIRESEWTEGLDVARRDVGYWRKLEAELAAS